MFKLCLNHNQIIQFQSVLPFGIMGPTEKTLCHVASSPKGRHRPSSRFYMEVSLYA